VHNIGKRRILSRHFYVMDEKQLQEIVQEMSNKTSKTFITEM